MRNGGAYGKFHIPPRITARTDCRAGGGISHRLALGKAMSSLHQFYDDEPTTLVRTKEGRTLSGDRYHSSEISFWAIEAGFFGGSTRVTLHQAGSVAKLALCAHLLDVGFPDDWNAAHIRQDIAKALAYANATGFGHDCPDHCAARSHPHALLEMGLSTSDRRSAHG
jgi:hypothetical protein